MRIGLMMAAMVLVSGAAGGCAFKGGQPEPGPALSDVWLPRPTTMRVYPATRYVRSGAETLLEARIELLDAMGDPVKGAGDFRLELYAADAGAGARGQQLYVWRVPLLTAEDQRRFYDPITRAYLLRLRVDEAVLDRRATQLYAMFAPVGAARIETQATITPRP